MASPWAAALADLQPTGDGHAEQQRQHFLVAMERDAQCAPPSSSSLCCAKWRKLFSCCGTHASSGSRGSSDGSHNCSSSTLLFRPIQRALSLASVLPHAAASTRCLHWPLTYDWGTCTAVGTPAVGARLHHADMAGLPTLSVLQLCTTRAFQSRLCTSMSHNVAQAVLQPRASSV